MAMRKTKTRRSAAPRTSRRKVTRQWSREEIAFMRKYYRGYETAWVARQLGRTVYSVRYKAVDLSLRKSSPKTWKGHVGSANAFKKSEPRRKTVSRRTASKRQTTRTRRFQASTSRRRPTRKAGSRKQVRKASPRKQTRKAAPRRRQARKASPRRRQMRRTSPRRSR